MQMINKKNVHTAGPIRKLLESGQIQRVDDEDNESSNPIENKTSSLGKKMGVHFKTETGIKFSESELTFVNPNECTPWEYANRLDDEMGDMDGLIQSLKKDGQLQPALVRPLKNQNNGFKYEVIFGRRRLAACLKLNIPLMVIVKQIENIQDAIAFQDAENKLRNDVSNYSNAMLYKKLLDDNIFKSARALAEALGLTTSSLNDLMAFTRLSHDIMSLIPNLHDISIRLALQISALDTSPINHNILIQLAPKIGKSITSASKLEQELLKKLYKESSPPSLKTLVYKSLSGKALFKLKPSPKGEHTIVFDKALKQLDYENLCKLILNHIEVNSN